VEERCTSVANVLKRRVLKTENLKQMFILLVGRMFIYKLEYEGLVLYVGQTKDMKNRYSKHYNRKDSCGSRDIPDDFHWTMVLLEDCEDVLATGREQFYYDTLKPLYNIKRPGQTLQEYQRGYKAAHPEQRRESSRKYEAAHREQRRESGRRYYEANKEVFAARQRKRREKARLSKQRLNGE
jgi:predicted GIY-YIG superfamily endonuclease